MTRPWKMPNDQRTAGNIGNQALCIGQPGLAHALANQPYEDPI